MCMNGLKKSLINYYEVAISGSNLSALTYAYEEHIDPYTEVEVLLRGKLKKAYVLGSVEKPSFKTLSVAEVSTRC